MNPSSGPREDHTFGAPNGKIITYNKTCLKRPLKKNTKIGFQDKSLLNAGQDICFVYF